MIIFTFYGTEVINRQIVSLWSLYFCKKYFKFRCLTKTYNHSFCEINNINILEASDYNIRQYYQFLITLLAGYIIIHKHKKNIFISSMDWKSVLTYFLKAEASLSKKCSEINWTNKHGQFYYEQCIDQRRCNRFCFMKTDLFITVEGVLWVWHV